MESLAQSMSYPGTIGGAVPSIVVIEPLHHQQQAQAFRKMANEEQDEATSLYI